MVTAAVLAVACAGAEEAPSPKPGSDYSVPIDIRGKKVRYTGGEGRAVFSGGVRVVRGTSVLTSDELETIRGSNEAVARGNVAFKDAERNLDLTCGEIVYAHGLKRILATRECRLLAGEGADLAVVTSNEMEMFVDKREAIASGEVRITQGENEAVCAKAHLFGTEDRMVLSGRPVLRRPPHEFECDQAVSYFKEGRTILTGSVRGKVHTARLDELKMRGGLR